MALVIVIKARVGVGVSVFNLSGDWLVTQSLILNLFQSTRKFILPCGSQIGA